MADILTMIVCDTQGHTQVHDSVFICMKNHTKEFYVFYAKRSAEDKDIREIILTMPVGGNQNGLLRLPHVGEKILVSQQGNQYFLIAYLPNTENMEFREKSADETEADEITSSESLTLRYKSPHAFPKENKGRSRKGISEIKFSTQETYWPETKDTIKKDSNVDFPSIDRIDVTSAGDVITTAQNYNEINASRVGIFAGVQEDLQKAKDKAKTLSAKATNGLEVLPQDSPDEFPRFSLGDIQIRADKKVMLSAKSGIVLRCGRSTVTIDDTGICLKSGKVSSIYPTPDDSSISITPMAGVSVAGDQVNLKANVKYSISEGMGGGISSLAGVTRINTHDFRVSTNATVDYAGQCFWAGARGVEQAATYVSTITGKHAGEGEASDHNTFIRSLLKYGNKIEMANTILPLLKTLYWKSGENAFEGDDGSKGSFNDVLGSCMSVANTIFSVLPIIYMVLDFSVPIEKKANKAYAESMNMINSALSYSVLAYLAATICAATAGIHYNALSLKGNGDTDMVSKTFTTTNLSAVEGLSPVAAVKGAAFGNSWGKKALITAGLAAVGGVSIWQMAETQLGRDVETMKDLQEL